MTDVLEIEGLHAGYNGAVVVRDLHLRVGEGEIVALLGANGAGKTTTLLTASGFLAPIAGDAKVLGDSVRGKRSHQIAGRGVAHVSEDRSLFHGLSVAENLRLGHRGAKRLVGDVLDLFPPLRPLLHRRAGLLSGGEQQMLALARALVSRPKLLMVDEMSLGLAPVIVETLAPVLEHIAREHGTGVLLVEQHVDLALSIADRAYVLSHGHLVIEGPASDLAQRTELLEISYLGENDL